MPARDRKVIDFRPYPNAPTRTPRSPANNPSRTLSRRPPTPATVWFTPTATRPGTTAPAGRGGATDELWPLPVLTRALTAFSRDADRVLLLPWPRLNADPILEPAAAPTDPARSSDAAALADAVAAVRGLGRDPRPENVPATTDAPTPQRDRDASRPVDLMITVMPSARSSAEQTDTVAALAARRLRLGGILAVLTHCHWDNGTLVDLSGPMVTAGQNADLLYLQHIVAVQVSTSDLRLQARPAAEARAGEPHRRVHSDVLVFAQPHDHDAEPGTTTPDPVP